MEKSKSFPQYSSSCSGEFGFGDRPNSYAFNGPTTNNGEGFAASNDPDLKRKKRVASYNLFATERKLKSSLSHGFRWIKSKFGDGDTRY
ncbi:hypothetical protein U1Q18_037494, partial [Sarracenia purpurea var. burkii]